MEIQRESPGTRFGWGCAGFQIVVGCQPSLPTVKTHLDGGSRLPCYSTMLPNCCFWLGAGAAPAVPAIVAIPSATVAVVVAAAAATPVVIVVTVVGAFVCVCVCVPRYRFHSCSNCEVYVCLWGGGGCSVQRVSIMVWTRR